MVADVDVSSARTVAGGVGYNDWSSSPDADAVLSHTHTHQTQPPQTTKNGLLLVTGWLVVDGWVGRSC